MKQTEDRCSKQVRMRTTMPRWKQCSNKAKVTRNGKRYCGRCDPERKQIEKKQKTADLKKAQYYAKNFLKKGK